MRRLNQHWYGIPPGEPASNPDKNLEPETGPNNAGNPTPKLQKPSESDRALHEQFVHYGQNAKEWLRKCVLLLPQIDHLRIWEKYGFSSIFEYAAKLAGMSRNKVKEGLRIMRKTENLPALRKVIEQKGIWAVKPILTLATPENEKELAHHAMNMSAATLTTLAKELRNKKEDQETEGREIASPENPLFTMGDCLTYEEKLELLLVSVDKEVARKLQKIKGQGDWNFVMKLLLQIWERQLELEKPQPVKTKSKHIPNIIRRYIMKRSSCYCEFPDCMKHYAELHHADRFSLVWKHDPDRIFALCNEHHDLVHHGVIENESSDIKLWRVQQKPNITDIRYVIDRAVIVHRKKDKKSGPPPSLSDPS